MQFSSCRVKLEGILETEKKLTGLAQFPGISANKQCERACKRNHVIVYGELQMLIEGNALFA